MRDRAGLADPALAPVWEAVRARLERSGGDSRGRLRLPHLTSRGRWLLTSLLDAPVGATVDLGTLEERLRALGVDGTLPGAVAALGYPVSGAPAARRASRAQAAAVRAAARGAAARWPEAWAAAWMGDVIRSGLLSGLDEEAALGLVARARAVLDRIGSPPTTAPDPAAAPDPTVAPDPAAAPDPATGPGVSRVDLAAEVLGSSHALDRGTREEAAVTRALHRWFPGESDRRCWERAGVLPDLVSAPVLTWGLRGSGTSGRSDLADRAGLSGLCTEAVDLGIPLHLSQMALRTHPVTVPRGADVLVAENPRIVEAAAQMAVPFAVVALNGNPAGAARLLLDQLLACGADLRYHGDFDAAGLGICHRMHRLGLTPWRMDRVSYDEAVAAATAAGAQLPVDAHPAPETPWDPALREVFDRVRLVVHEERLLPGLLDSCSPGSRRSSRRS